MSKKQRMVLAQKIARELFTSGTGEHAEIAARLSLQRKNWREMGAWSEKPMADIISGILEKEGL